MYIIICIKYIQWRRVERLLKKLKIEPPYNPAIPLLGTYPEKIISQKIHELSHHSGTIYNNEAMEATEMPIDRWVDKDVVHTHNGVLLGHKKEQNNAMRGDMRTQRLRYEVKQVGQRKMNFRWCHLYVESKLGHRWTYLWNRNRLTDRESKSVITEGESREGWMRSWGLRHTHYRV